MKTHDVKDLDQLPGIRLEKGDTFRFRCHSDLGCFNRCCRNLNLFLYPYDVVRLKSALGITSDRFLDRYVDVVLRPGEFFPEVLLRMSDNKDKTCPYLTPDGCSVYPDRPDTCRTFPVEQGALFDAKTRKSRRVHFFRPPSFCLGRHEQETWTPESWTRDQGALVHNQMTLLWADLRSLFQSDPWGAEGPEGKRAKMTFMAAYNVDRFREFVFNSSFLKRYKVKPALLKKLKKDDTQLLKFGFQWIKFFVWGIKANAFKPKR